MMLPPLLQMAVFQAMGLAPIRLPPHLRHNSPDARRIALFVPKSGLILLRAFRLPEVFLSLTGVYASFDNIFTSVHMAFVRVHRGGGISEENAHGWRSLNSHLSVRDTREDDPEAELMVSALVPTFALTVTPPSLTELQLRPQKSTQISEAPKHIKKKLGGEMWEVFYKADLGDADRVAVLTPTGQGGGSIAKLRCPLEVVTDRRQSQSSRVPVLHVTQTVLHHSTRSDFVVDHSIELIRDFGMIEGSGLVYKVTLRMADDGARDVLATGGAAVDEKAGGLCSVCVELGGRFAHFTHFPFPVKKGAINLNVSKRQGHAIFTVPPSGSPTQIPVTSLAGLPSSLFWSPCVPLASLPRLDFQAEWTHGQVRKNRGPNQNPFRQAVLRYFRACVACV